MAVLFKKNKKQECGGSTRPLSNKHINTTKMLTLSEVSEACSSLAVHLGFIVTCWIKSLYQVFSIFTFGLYHIFFKELKIMKCNKYGNKFANRRNLEGANTFVYCILSNYLVRYCRKYWANLYGNGAVSVG